MPSPETIQFLSVLAAFSLLAMGFASSIFGVLAYFIVMATRMGLYYPSLGGIRIELVVALIVLLQVFLRKGALQKLRPSYNIVNRYMFLFLAVIFLSFFQAFDYQTSWHNGVREFLKTFCFYLMILASIDSERKIRIFLWAFCFLTVFMGYEGVYSALTGAARYAFRDIDIGVASRGFASGHVAAANIQLQCLPIVLVLAQGHSRRLFRATAALLAGLSVAIVIATGSRGGFAGLIFLMILSVYFAKRRLPAIAACSVLFLVSLAFLSDSYLAWMRTILSPSDLSAESRILGLLNGIDMLVRRPLLGVGPECYPVARKAWFGWGLHAHNHLGQLLGDLGLIGTVVWGLFLYQVFMNLRKAKAAFDPNDPADRQMVLIVTGLQMALWVRLFEGYGSHSLYIFFWYLVAALSIALRKTAEERGRTAEEDRSAAATSPAPLDACLRDLRPTG
ncbi:MAG: O-antigen ligase family protein [bacterium]